MVMMKENEEDLALFLDLQKREKDSNSVNFIHNTDDFDGRNPGSSPISKILSSMPARKNATEEFLNSENGKADYDWLLAPPGDPLFPTLEMDMEKTTMCQKGIPNARLVALMSRPVNSLSGPLSKSSLTSRQASSAPALAVSNAGSRRSSSVGRASTNCRPSTPTGRPTLPAIVKASRPSTPTARPTVPSTIKSTTSGIRSSTPTRPTPRSSTPTARHSLPASKPTSRSATPTRRSSTPSSFPNVSAPPVRSSLTKSAPTARNPMLSRGVSPPVKSRPWKPSEMPGFSAEVPPNLRTSMPERPSSASKGRPGAPNANPSSVEEGNKRHLKQQSCSPSRGRQPPHGNVYGNGNSVSTRSRAHSNNSDYTSPGLIGTQMVERVVNMRRLAPPKQDDSSGFGRTLSNKSLDMAIRHMDIRRTVSGNLRPILTKVPASSMYSVRSGDSRSGTLSVSNSPFATSSNASSEPSVNHNFSYFNGSDMGDDEFGSERDISSLAIHQGR